MSLPAHTPGESGYHVTINSQSCNRRAFWCLDGWRLTAGRDTRGQRDVRPNTAGRLRGKRFTEDREIDLEFLFDGAHDISGAASADREDELSATIEWFEENIVFAAGDARSRLSVTVEGKGGREWSGLLQVIAFERGEGLYECGAVLTVALDTGRLTPSGS